MTLHILIADCGLAIVGLAVVDELHTTMGPAAGPGPLSRLVLSTLRRVAVRADSYHHRRRGLVGGPGVAIVAVTVATWFALLWLGWGLVFVAGGRAVVSSSTGAAASIAERFYFAGYTLTTLGNGAFQPSGPWEWAPVGAALSGLTLVTLAITFVVPVISAVVGKRRFASEVHALGSTADDIAASLHGAGGFGAALHIVAPLADALATIVEQHRAYPLLHEFRSPAICRRRSRRGPAGARRSSCCGDACRRTSGSPSRWNALCSPRWRVTSTPPLVGRRRCPSRLPRPCRLYVPAGRSEGGGDPGQRT
ncbi:MAG: ion channel [Actinomycetota bacterium]|nr:ion channel [Actinomycetota bacterium]